MQFQDAIYHVFEDLDDSGYCPISLDILRYFLSLRLDGENQSTISELAEFYEASLTGNQTLLEFDAEEYPDLEKEIKIQQVIRKNIEKLKTIQDFFNLNFINLISDMERSVMLRVHSDFSSLFERWFSILVDPQNLQVKLDEEFSPIIEQNGYNLDYEYLSVS